MVGLKGEEKRRYVADLFTRIARRYDFMNTLMTGGMHHRWRRRTAQRAMAELDGLALDIGTGTGDLALTLAQTDGVTGVVGVDLVPSMVALAEGKAHSKFENKAAYFLVGDALSLPFPDDTFACATSAFVLRNMPDLKTSLQEMFRVVQPGGRVVSLEITPLERGPFVPLFRLYFHRVVPLVGALISRDRAAYTYLPQSVDHFPSAESLVRLLVEVGLRDVGYERMGLGTVVLYWGTKGAQHEVADF